MNLFPGYKGHYIYEVKSKPGRFLAQIKYPCGYSRSGLFYSLDDALTWMLSQRESDKPYTPYTPYITPPHPELIPS